MFNTVIFIQTLAHILNFYIEQVMHYCEGRLTIYLKWTFNRKSIFSWQKFVDPGLFCSWVIPCTSPKWGQIRLKIKLTFYVNTRYPFKTMKTLIKVLLNLSTTCYDMSSCCRIDKLLKETQTQTRTHPLEERQTQAMPVWGVGFNLGLNNHNNNQLVNEN